MPSEPKRARVVDRAAAASAIDTFLRAIGVDAAADPELPSTGARVADAFIDELTSGYDVDALALARAAAIPSAELAPLVVVRGIDLTTTCPHHLMSAIGKADIAFAPAGHLIGIGAVAEIARALARRLVLQEALTASIADALFVGLAPRWAAVRLELAHGCMIARGERAHGARVETLVTRGAISATEATTILTRGEAAS